MNPIRLPDHNAVPSVPRATPMCFSDVVVTMSACVAVVAPENADMTNRTPISQYTFGATYNQGKQQRGNETRPQKHHLPPEPVGKDTPERRRRAEGKIPEKVEHGNLNAEFRLPCHLKLMADEQRNERHDAGKTAHGADLGKPDENQILLPRNHEHPLLSEPGNISYPASEIKRIPQKNAMQEYPPARTPAAEMHGGRKSGRRSLRNMNRAGGTSGRRADGSGMKGNSTQDEPNPSHSSFFIYNYL